MNNSLFKKTGRILIILIPIALFFLLNRLTPFWWDDYIMACSFENWNIEHQSLLSSFSDVIKSTSNMYNNWHGRIIVDFINFTFMLTRNKLLFDFLNTAVYAIFVFLISYHIEGSFRKIKLSLILLIHFLIWFLIPEWGQNFLWLTGSINYLWTGTIILFFLIPYRKSLGISNKTSYFITAVWFFVGILAGWTMENSAAGAIIFSLLVLFFDIKNKDIKNYRISGIIGSFIGYYFLISARSGVFPKLSTIILNFIEITINTLYLNTILYLILILIIIFRKNIKEKYCIFYYITGIVAIYSLVLPGYYPPRAAFMAQIYFLISLIILIEPFIKNTIKTGVQKNVSKLILSSIFISSFLPGLISVSESFILFQSRDFYISEMVASSEVDIVVKTPVPSRNTHSGFHGGIDFLDVADKEQLQDYTAHSSAKKVWYNVDSITGHSTVYHNTIKRSIRKVLDRGLDDLTLKSILKQIYKDW